MSDTVSITHVDSPVNPGDTVNVDYIVQTDDPFGSSGTVELRLEPSGIAWDSDSYSLDHDDDTDSGTLQWDTASDQDPSTYSVYAVIPGEDSDSSSVTVEEPDPEFSMGIFSYDSEVGPGEQISFTVGVNNVGEGSGTADVEADGTVRDTTSTIDPGNNYISSFSVTAQSSEGTQWIPVNIINNSTSNVDDGDAANVQVSEEDATPDAEFAIVGTPSYPSEVETGGTINFSWEIENVGSETGSARWTIDYDGTETDPVEIDPSESETNSRSITAPSEEGQETYSVQAYNDGTLEADDEYSATIDVVESDPEVGLNVDIIDVSPSEADPGDDISANYLATTEDPFGASGTVTLTIGDPFNIPRDSENVSLSHDGDSQSGFLTMGTRPDIEPGEYTVYVYTDDDIDSDTFEIVQVLFEPEGFVETRSLTLDHGESYEWEGTHEFDFLARDSENVELVDYPEIDGSSLRLAWQE